MNKVRTFVLLGLILGSMVIGGCCGFDPCNPIPDPCCGGCNDCCDPCGAPAAPAAAPAASCGGGKSCG
jgi:hypothetical protein